MAQIRHTITANKPDGKLVKICGKTPQSVTVIQNAMVASGYTNIKVTKDPTPEALFVRGLMKTHNISAKEAMVLYKQMIEIMSLQGIQIVRKEDVHEVI